MRERVTKRRRISKKLYRNLLLSKKQDLLSLLGVKFDTLASLDHVNEEDQAQASHDEFVSLRLTRLDYDLLQLVEEALERLRTGEYGTCLECGEPIAEKRLRAVPWAMFCVDCQQRIGEAAGARSLGAPAEYSLRL